MKYKYLFFVACASLTLSSCGLFSKYEQSEDVKTKSSEILPTLYGAEANTQESPLQGLSWREFFTDPLLQQLIEQVLANNTDLNSARIAVEKCEASLKIARMAYLPSLYFSPQGTLAKFDGNPLSKTYNLPLQLSMDIDAFGAITNKKRASEAVLLQARMGEEAVRANLVSVTAQQYYLLQVLDRQLEILTQTDSLWNASLETQKTLWENGKAYSTAVNQMESSYLNVKTQIVDTRRNIQATENALCRLMAITPQHIERNAWGSSALSHATETADAHMFDTRFLNTGVPARLLELHPEIRMANHAMEEAFYNTKEARSAFFPTITLQGILGWTNSGGGMIVNPGKILINALASLTQPIFARGRIKANYKINQLTEEDLRQKYVQTVINIGNQVNEALADCQAAREKHGYYHRQVEVLREAYMGTHELMDNGKANYLEVLTAQESLLNSQLNEAMNMYKASQAVIALYISLGGGTEALR